MRHGKDKKRRLAVSWTVTASSKQGLTVSSHVIDDDDSDGGSDDGVVRVDDKTDGAVDSVDCEVETTTVTSASRWPFDDVVRGLTMTCRQTTQAMTSRPKPYDG